ncbi:MAG: response regulator [Lachnospiraceae bacterium]|nr:response regulator [Lachnospiraceae bacterium]
MRIITVDDEKFELESLTRAVKEAVPDAEVESFREAVDALKYASANLIDVAFLDIEMKEMSGIMLGKRLKLLNPKTNVIFATGYTNYREVAFDMHASGYITKPITVDRIKEEMKDLRYPLELKSTRTIRVQTFGDFEVFVNDKHAEFKYIKTKELFAFLVDRHGEITTNAEQMKILFGDDTHSSDLQCLHADLRDVLKKSACEDALVQRWGKLGVAPDKLDCDAYDWEKGLAYALNSYKGEYMAQYDWAKFSSGVPELAE